MYMYILSRVFLFPRFISPVAVVSRDTFYHYFVFLSSRMVYESKAALIRRGNTRFSRRVSAERKERNACEVTKDIGRSDAHGAKSRRTPRGSPRLALRSIENKLARSLEGKPKEKEEYIDEE